MASPYGASWSHSDTPHSVGLLWTIDQPDAETSSWQHTTLKRGKHQCPGGIQTLNPCKRTAAEPLLGPRGHWDRQPINSAREHIIEADKFFSCCRIWMFISGCTAGCHTCPSSKTLIQSTASSFYSLNINLNIPPSTPRASKWYLFPSGFPTKIS